MVIGRFEPTSTGFSNTVCMNGTSLSRTTQSRLQCGNRMHNGLSSRIVDRVRVRLTTINSATGACASLWIKLTKLLKRDQTDMQIYELISSVTQLS